MANDDELVKYEDQGLVLLHPLFACSRVLLNHQVYRIQNVLEPHQANQIKVFGPLKATHGQRNDDSKQSNDIWDEPRANVATRCLFECSHLADEVNAIEVDEKVKSPKAVEEDLKGQPVHTRVLLMVKVVREADRQRRNNDILEDDQGEEAVPDLHRLRVCVELEPLDHVVVQNFGIFVRV